MQTIEAEEAAMQFDSLLRRVMAGEEFLITMNNEPVAYMLPLEQQSPKNLDV